MADSAPMVMLHMNRQLMIMVKTSRAGITLERQLWPVKLHLVNPKIMIISQSFVALITLKALHTVRSMPLHNMALEMTAHDETLIAFYVSADIWPLASVNFADMIL